ncbi:ABC transporter transmembrane domain-containing protein [Thaumasiovibrio subtropicus]|uniref:ABC transporter transmembrane domain-containing protein n=1 Tax=Thaumasiovibrio subtropicus TaxID=1891207 RepID=UPI000B34DE96|nr:ABC transporter transmembrane domain-containing protein [Thaumasiovibrio subtropicus]
MSNLIPKIHRWDTVYITISTLVTTLLGLVLPFSILIIFDRILPNSSTNSLIFLYIIILSSIVVDYLIKKSEESLVSRIASRTEKRIIDCLFNAVCKTDLSRYKQHNIGSLLERVASIPEIKDFHSGESIKAWINLFTSAVTVALIFLISAKAGMVLIAASIVLLIAALYLSNRRVKLIKLRNDIESEANSRVIEIVSNPLAIKSRSMEYRVENYMDVIVEDREDKSVEFESIDASFNLILAFIQQLSVAVVVVVCAMATINLEISQGVMAAVILLTNRYFSPYQQVMRFISRWKMVNIRLKEVEEIIELENESNYEHEIINIERIHISSDREIDLNIGKVHLFQGPSSSGKSFLAKHISMETNTGFFDIFINNTEIHHFNYHHIRNTVIAVDTNSQFIDGTIIDNLTSFRPELNKSAITLCEALNIRTNIDELKNGFYTDLSSTALIPFSRQVMFTLFIIRALLSSKRVIIIDDIDMVHDKKFEDALLNVCIPRCRQKLFVLISNKITPPAVDVVTHTFEMELTHE